MDFVVEIQKKDGSFEPVGVVEADDQFRALDLSARFNATANCRRVRPLNDKVIQELGEKGFVLPES